MKALNIITNLITALSRWKSMQPFVRIDSREGPSRYQRVSEAKGIVIAVKSQDILHMTVKSQWKPFHQRKRHTPLRWKSQHRSNQFSTMLCLEQLVTMIAVQFIGAIRTALNGFHINWRRQKIMPWPLTETPSRTRKNTRSGKNSSVKKAITLTVMIQYSHLVRRKTSWK